MDRPRAMEEELPSSSAIFISGDSFPARSGRTPAGASSNGSGLFPANHNSNPSGGAVAAGAAGRLGNSGARTLRLAVEAQTTFIAETADLLAVESRVQQQQRGRVPSRSSDDSFGSTIPSSSFSSPVQSPFSHSSFPTSPPSSSLSSPPLSSPAIQTPGSPSSPDASPQPLDPQLLRFSLVKAAGTEKERQLLEVLLRVYIPNTPDFEIWRQLPPEKLQEMVRWSLRTSDLRPHPMPETIIQRKFLAQTTAKPATTNAASKRKRVARRTVSQLEPSPPGWNDQGLWQVDLCFAFTFPTKTLAPVYISFEIEGLGLALSHPIVAFIHVREYPVALESILWHKLGRSRGSVPVEHALFAIDRFFLCWKSVRPIRDDIDLRYLLQQARATSPHLTESEFGIIWKRAYAMHELLLEDENFKTLWRNRPKLVEGYAMRDDTERLLLGHPTGTFLIRLGSQEAKVSISYRSTEFGVQHALIEHTKTKEDESYRDANSDECYPSLFKLILRSPTLEQILVTQANGGTQVIPKSAMEPLLRNSERKRRARTDYQSLDGAPNGTCLSCEEKDRRIEELQSELENLKVLLELERSVFQPPVSDVVAELGMSYLNIAQKNDAPPACWPIPQPLSLGPHQGAPVPSTSAGMRHAAEVDAYLISGT